MARDPGLLALAALCACTQQSQDALARAAAKRVITAELESKFPGVPLEPAVDCVLAQASADQIVQIARDAEAGKTGDAVKTVAGLVAHGDTVDCLAEKELPAFLGTAPG